MNSIEKTEHYVAELLELAAMYRDGRVGAVYDCLTHLMTGIALYEQLSDDEREMVQFGLKKVQYFFCTKISLKERKRNKEKKIIPPNPLLKEKEKKEKAEKTHSHAADAKEVFRKECWAFTDQYDCQAVADFFYYWSEMDDSGQMRFQKEPFWTTENRLKRWVNNLIEKSKASAAIRLKRQQQRLSKQERDSELMEQQAEERKEVNTRLDREIMERKRGAVSYEEYLAMKEGAESDGERIQD